MKKRTIFLILVLVITFCSGSLLSVQSSVPDSWVTMAPLPVALSSSQTITIDEAIYTIGTYYNYSMLGYVNVNYRYEPSNNTWTAKALPSNLTGGIMVVCQSKIYVIGARLPPDGWVNGSAFMQVYDPATDTWKEKAPMPTGRIQLQANVVDDKIYAIGGSFLQPNGQYPIATNQNEVYDTATNTWSTMAPIPNAVKSYASVVVDGKIYIIGGAEGGYPDLNSIVNFVQIFDPKTNTWSQGTPMPINVKAAAASATTGLVAPRRIYIVGGDKGDANNGKYYNYTPTPTDATQIYNPQTDSWTTGASMPTARYSLTLANVNDTLYAIGGLTSDNYSAANEKYLPLGYSGLPSPSLSPSQTQIPSPSESPILSTSPSASQQPIKTSEPTPITTAAEFNYIIATVVAIALIVTIAFILKRRR